MKQKLLKNSLLLFLSGIIIVSCTLENEVLHEHHHKKGIKVETMRYADLMKTSQFSKAVKRIPKKQVLTQDLIGRSIVEDTYGFTILDAPIKVVEVDNKTSYTLQVVSDDNTTGELENLILFENPTDDKIGHIVTYNTSSNTDKTANEIVDAGIKQEATITTDGISSNNTNGKFVIVSYFYSLCNGIPYDCGGSVCGFGYHQETIWIPEIGGGGGDGGTGAGGGDGGSGSGGGTGYATGNGDTPPTDNPIVLTPTHCPGGCPEIEEEVTPFASPCNKIKNLHTKHSDLKSALVTLTGTTSASQENGIYMYSSATSTSINPIQPLPSYTSAGVTAVGLPDPPSPEKYSMIAHTHDATGPTGTGSFSIFSWQDLTRFAELIHDGKIDNSSFVTFLATADGTRYALTIEFSEAFADYFDIRKNYNQPSSNYNMDFKKAAEIDEDRKKYYSNSPSIGKIHLTSNPADDLIVFLKMKKDLKLDFTLFEVDPTYTTYTKVSLSSDGTTVKRDNCK